MMNLKRAAIIAGIVLTAPLATAAAASATQNHDDPCPGQHAQVYNENSYVEVAHFVCNTPGSKGDAGKDGKDGIDGKDGSKGDTGAAGAAGIGLPGLPGAPGAPGAVGAAGAAGVDGGIGPVGAAGAAGVPGAPGVDGAAGAAGETPVVADVPGVDLGPCGSEGGTSLTLGEQVRYICNGPVGEDGMTGDPGEDGVSKTVIVHSDGSQEVVPTLPHTGATGDWQLALVGVALLAGGCYLVVKLRS